MLRPRLIKHIFLGVLLTCFALNCQAKYKADNERYQRDLKMLTDSLNASGVDTLVTYKHGCSGCIEGIESITYFFWTKGAHTYSCTVDNYFGISYIIETNSVMAYFNKHEQDIRKQALDSTIYSFHNHYSDLHIYAQGKEYYSISIPDYYKVLNHDTYIMNYIYRMEYIVHQLDYDTAKPVNINKKRY